MSRLHIESGERLGDVARLHIPAADHRSMRNGANHGLANREFLFPFASVVEVDQR